MTAADGMRALVIEHERVTPGGLVYQWLEERGAECDIYRIDVDDRHFDPRDYAMIASLGSEFPAYDDSLPWLHREMELMREATEHDVPILGICFGSQLLARLRGGRVWRSERSEIGWLPVRTRDPETVPEGPWLQWHFDVFEPPPGAEEIAYSPVASQAYTIEGSLGVQFHPEVTPEIMESWVRVYRHELDADGVDPGALLRETHERAADTRAMAWRFFDNFIDHVAGRGREVASGG